MTSLPSRRSTKLASLRSDVVVSGAAVLAVDFAQAPATMTNMIVTCTAAAVVVERNITSSPDKKGETSQERAGERADDGYHDCGAELLQILRCRRRRK